MHIYICIRICFVFVQIALTFSKPHKVVNNYVFIIYSITHNTYVCIQYCH